MDNCLFISFKFSEKKNVWNKVNRSVESNFQPNVSTKTISAKKITPYGEFLAALRGIEPRLLE